jgi:D-amino peptidase
VRGAKAAGATEIVVMDCHGAGKGWTFNSLIPEDLDPDCEFVVQNEWTLNTSFVCLLDGARLEATLPT